MRIHFGHRVRVLHWCTDQLMTANLARMELTASQGGILGFLAHWEGPPPCQKDLEAVLQLSHPTVSGLLSRMEKKGFLEVQPDQDDRRFKRVRLLPKGEECICHMDQAVREIEARFTQGFSSAEQRQFADYLERAIHNMGGDAYPHSRCHKEDFST